MGITRYEQEVTINFNAEEDTATVYAANPSWIRKLDKLVAANPEEFRQTGQELLDGQIISKRYEFPKKLLTVRSRTIKRELTEEQRQQAAERLKESRKRA